MIRISKSLEAELENMKIPKEMIAIAYEPAGGGPTQELKKNRRYDYELTMQKIAEFEFETRKLNDRHGKDDHLQVSKFLFETFAHGIGMSSYQRRAIWKRYRVTYEFYP